MKQRCFYSLKKYHSGFLKSIYPKTKQHHHLIFENICSSKSFDFAVLRKSLLCSFLDCITASQRNRICVAAKIVNIFNGEYKSSFGFQYWQCEFIISKKLAAYETGFIKEHTGGI